MQQLAESWLTYRPAQSFGFAVLFVPLWQAGLCLAMYRAALTGKHDTLVRRAPGWQGALRIHLTRLSTDGLGVSRHFGPKTLRTYDISAPLWWCRSVRTFRHWCRSVLRKNKATHTIKLITQIMSHVCTTNKWNKPSNTMSCNSVVLCSYYF